MPAGAGRLEGRYASINSTEHRTNQHLLKNGHRTGAAFACRVKRPDGIKLGPQPAKANHRAIYIVRALDSGGARPAEVTSFCVRKSFALPERKIQGQQKARQGPTSQKTTFWQMVNGTTRFELSLINATR
jgi:hypothetical protein